MADFLDKTRTEIAARLKELRPLVDEYDRLRAAVTALEGISTPTASAGARTRAARSASTSAKPAGGRPSARPSVQRGRPKGSGARGAQALQLVRDNPGITVPQIAEKIGIKQNYLYRVLSGLAEDGLVVKEGRGWRADESANVLSAV